MKKNHFYKAKIVAEANEFPNALSYHTLATDNNACTEEMMTLAIGIELLLIVEI